MEKIFHHLKYPHRKESALKTDKNTPQDSLTHKTVDGNKTLSNTIKEQYQTLSTLSDHAEKKEAILDLVAQIAEELAIPLNLAADEIAVQVIVGDGNSLRFLYPRVLFDSGATFPISTTSIAGSSVMMQKTSFNNHASSTRHLLFFEKLNTGVRSPLPIHKMATIPLISNNQVIGTVQLSRRAETFDEAGADFTDACIELIQQPLMLINALFEDHVFGKM